MRFLFSCLFLVSFFNGFSQDEPPKIQPIVKIDSLYREDQLYFSITYNMLVQGPEGLKQDKFSAGFSTGFLRDIPLNKKRTFAIAPGLGFSYQNYYQNLTVSTTVDGSYLYGVNNYNEFVSNRFRQYSVDLPIEFRWRNSTFESTKFWRIYAGFKFSYVFAAKSILNDGETTYKIKNNPDLNDFQYGAYISAGYNTWNVYAYYGLNPLYKSYVKTLNGESVNMRTLNLGLMFYIL